MAQELGMSLTRYLQIKDKLVPKHLCSNEQQRKKDNIRKLMLADSPVEIIRKAKQKYLRPIAEIETIMDHFDSKFTNKRVKLRESTDNPRRRKRAASIMTEGSNTQRELQSKMQYLINLPSIGRVKKEAERYRGILRADEIKEKEDRKARIIEEFNRYMDAELRGNPKPSIQRRAHTLQ